MSGVAVADLLVVTGSFVLGYALGSLPLVALVGRMAGLEPVSTGAGGVWRRAGPGWGLLAVAADLARGILPVALAIVTFSGWAGWVAGLGAVLAAVWPAAGRLPADRSLGLVIGVLFVVMPLVGVAAATVAVLTLVRRAATST